MRSFSVSTANGFIHLNVVLVTHSHSQTMCKHHCKVHLRNLYGRKQDIMRRTELLNSLQPDSTILLPIQTTFYMIYAGTFVVHDNLFVEMQ